MHKRLDEKEKGWCHYLAVDTEARGTRAVDARRKDTEVTHISWWNERGEGESVPFLHNRCHKSWWVEKQWHKSTNVARAIEDPRVIKLFWNAKYDLKVLQRAGIQVKGPIIDVMLLARIVHTAERPGQYTLKHFSRKFLENTYVEETKLRQWCTKQKRKKEPCAYGDAPLHILHPYSLLDAQCTFELFWLMSKKLTNPLARLLKIEHQVLARTITMENRGLLIDEDLCLDLMARCTKDMQRSKGALRKVLKNPLFNPNSHQQVAQVFFTDEGRNPVALTPTGQPTTDKVAMLTLRDKYDDTRAQLVMDWRKVAKARDTYLKRFLDDRDEFGILRGYFNQSGTRTGRFSSSEPNLQNITRPSAKASGRLRDCFISRPNYRFICIDYDQIELRLGAHFAQVTNMLEAIHNGVDLHGDTAIRMFGVTPESEDWTTKRQISKTLNFAIFFGIGSEEFMNTLIRESEMYLSLYQAADFRKTYKDIYPEIDDYFETITQEVLETGGVTNPYGRFMETPRGKSYIGVNYKIQSTAADLIKERMLVCADLLRGKKSGLVAIVHDELIFEMHYEDKYLIPRLKKEMEELKKFSVPLTCSVAQAKRWGKKRKIKVVAA